MAEPLVDFLARYATPISWFAELCGLTIDDVYAISDNSAIEPPPRISAIVALLKAAGVAKTSSVLRRFQLEHGDPDWREIPGFPAYQASTCGKVRRIRASNVGLRVLKQMIGNRGYLKLTLYDALGTQCTVMVHRAVCLAWHGPPQRVRNFACHRNGDQLDNRADNLYWGTPIDNARDCLIHGKHISQNRGKYVQNAYSRSTPRKIRIAFEEGIISRKQYLTELEALNSPV